MLNATIATSRRNPTKCHRSIMHPKDMKRHVERYTIKYNIDKITDFNWDFQTTPFWKVIPNKMKNIAQLSK